MNGSGETECAGSCEGMCTGSCESDVMADASCTGTCRGECTITPADGNCQGAVSASCEASASAMVECRGRCRGRLHPPKAKAECEASAKAEAKLNVECTPPRLAVHYTLKVVDVDIDLDVVAQARFEAGLQGLRTRLPSLLAALERANSVNDAGVELIADGRVAVKGGINAALDAVGDGNIRVVAGLHCALEEADNVEAAIDASTQKLAASRQHCADLTAALNMGGV